MADSHADDRVVSPVCSYRRKDTGDRCTGKLADGFAGCLAHLTTDQLDQALQRLHPGADLDASGTPINADLLAQILHAVRGDHERPTFGEVSFTHAHFTDSSARALPAGPRSSRAMARARLASPEVSGRRSRFASQLARPLRARTSSGDGQPQRPAQLRHRGEHVLAVVDDQQKLLSRQHPCQRIHQRRARRLTQPERCGDSHLRQRRLLHAGKLHQPGASSA